MFKSIFSVPGGAPANNNENKESNLNTNNLTTTENGDPAFKSTNSVCLDFFANVCRDGNELGDEMKIKILDILPKCWAESPLDTVKLIYYKRNCRGGAGEKKIFEVCFLWLIENHLETALKNLQYIPDFGYYKDLLRFLESSIREEVIKLFATQLKLDSDALVEYKKSHGNTSKSQRVRRPKKSEEKKESNIVEEATKLPSISLAAKWAPSLNAYHDKKFNICNELIKELGFKKEPQKLYRGLLSSLREHLRVVERLMSSARWDEIKYEQVPSVAMNRLKKAFAKHSPEKFQEWLSRVKAGTSKVNAGQLHPHELIRGTIDEVAEEQWKVIVEETKKLGSFSKCLCISDLSGSMGGFKSIPHDVSVALGVLISQCCEGPFHNLMISFSESPTFFELKGETLQERVNEVVNSPGQGLNTDLTKCFQVILNRAKENKVAPEDMPEKIFIISDMHFDQATHHFGVNSFETIKRLYSLAGYKVPGVIFWNVHGNLSSFPVTREEIGTCMLSGFSPSLLKVILDGEIPDPYTIMRKAIDAECYNVLSV